MSSVIGVEPTQRDVKDIEILLRSLGTDRLADFEDGRYFARIKVRQAAAELGLTMGTLQKYNKDLTGPECEIGHGGHLTFSFKAIDKWQSVREKTSQARPARTLVRQQELHAVAS
jgi:hypothetical protein